MALSNVQVATLCKNAKEEQQYVLIKAYRHISELL